MLYFAIFYVNGPARAHECVGSIECIGSIESIGSIVHTGNIPPLKLMNWTEKTRRGGEGELAILVANPIIKLSFYSKHDFFSWFVRSFCTWHFVGNMT